MTKFRYNGRVALAAAALMSVSSGQAWAAGFAEEMRWTGFMTAGAAKTDADALYLGQFGDDAGYTDTRLGLNVAADFQANLSVAGQILMAGREDDWNAHADWLFASWKPNDSMALMGGRIKYPNLLVSEYYDVGYTYPWIRPPEELYSFDPLAANATYEDFSGVSAVFSTFVGSYQLELQPYAGNAGTEVGSVGDMYGAAATASNDYVTMKLGYNAGDLGFGGGGHGGGGGDLAGALEHDLQDKQKTVSSAGVSVDWNNLVVMAEYAQTEVEDAGEFDTNAWYTTVGYRQGRYLPYVTMAELDQDSGSGQESTALGLRVNLIPGAALKVEWKNIEPSQRDEEITDEHGDEVSHPAGLFEHLPADDRVNMVSVAVDFVF